MNSTCPYARISYATWRSRVLGQLCADAQVGSSPTLSFLYPRSLQKSHDGRRDFHQSTARRRGKVKDMKRSARHRVVQLELPKLPEDIPTTEQAEEDNASRLKVRPRRKTPGQWSPYSEGSISEMEDLIGGLRDMADKAKERALRDEESIPFQGSRVLAREKRSQAESPLERKLQRTWEKKLQIQEVELDKKLENNVWAQMLASPSRMERGTKARLPRDLMIAWGAIQNPKDGKDYFLPIELSDLEELRRSLEVQDKSSAEKIPLNEKKEDADNDSPQSQPYQRVPLAPDKLLLQTLTEDFIYHKPGHKQIPASVATNSAKLQATLIPYRWRYKQTELQAFHRTRQKFNEALGREPDADEPNVSDMAKLGQLQWQPDMVERVEKILRERVLIALEALGRDNSSGRAVHQRKVSVLPVPKEGQLYTDGKEKISASNPPESPDSLDTVNDQTTADWMHGAILLHVGSPTSYRTTIERWHQHHTSDLEQLPQTHLLPPTVTINKHFRLPVFNLDSLFRRNHTRRIQEVLQAHKVFTPAFWTRWLDETRGAQTSSGSGLVTEVSAALDAGAEVLSAIVTPASSGPTVSPSAGVSSTDEAISDTEPYLVLVKARAKHAGVLAKEIWQLWRYVGGRTGLDLGGEDGVK